MYGRHYQQYNFKVILFRRQSYSRTLFRFFVVQFDSLGIIWFQQDGAPPHFGVSDRRYLDQIYPNQWIGQRGAIERPP